MTEEELKQQEQEQAEKQGEINALQNLLQQMDYSARKVAFEAAEIIRAQFPSADMPEYEKYKAAEAKAKQFRERINELEA